MFCLVELSGLEPLTPCLQSTPRLSDTVADLAISGSISRSQTGSVESRCGQHRWSASMSAGKRLLRPGMTARASHRFDWSGQPPVGLAYTPPPLGSWLCDHTESSGLGSAPRCSTLATGIIGVALAYFTKEQDFYSILVGNL